LTANPASTHDGQPHDRPASGPAAAYAFPLPEPGSYGLPAIKPAPGGQVLDETGAPLDLARLVAGRVTVLALVFCPIATARLSQLYQLAAQDPQVAPQLRLVSMSFDPAHDTPEVMAEQAELWRGPAGGEPEWLFLTAPDETALRPILAPYGQFVDTPDPARSSRGAQPHPARVPARRGRHNPQHL
jgi:protein SCO1